MSRNRPPETIADQLMKLGELAFLRYLGKVEMFFACHYEAKLSHEANWELAMAAIDSGWTPEKELNAQANYSRDGAVSMSAITERNAEGLAAQLRRKWKLGV